MKGWYIVRHNANNISGILRGVSQNRETPLNIYLYISLLSAKIADPEAWQYPLFVHNFLFEHVFSFAELPAKRSGLYLFSQCKAVSGV